MPTVLQINGYKFKFYSNENDEPAHIHIVKGNGTLKFGYIHQYVKNLVIILQCGREISGI